MYGGIASALSDLIGHFAKPEGAYIPWLTIMAFVGGVMKGVIWRALSRERKSRAFRTAVIVVLAALGVLGVSSHIALASDGVINSLTVTASELPTRGMTDSAEAEDRLGFISKTVISLARYNNDVFTVLGVTDGAEVVLPSEAVLDGYRRPVTKLGSGALSECIEMTRLVIPSSYKAAGLPSDALGDIDASRITIVGEGGSGAQEFAASVGAVFEASDSIEDVTLELSSSGGVASMTSDGYTVRSSDTFRRNLSGYIAISTIGPEAVCLAGLLYLVLDSLIAALDPSARSGQERHTHTRLCPYCCICNLVGAACHNGQYQDTSGAARRICRTLVYDTLDTSRARGACRLHGTFVYRSYAVRSFPPYGRAFRALYTDRRRKITVGK